MTVPVSTFTPPKSIGKNRFLDVIGIYPPSKGCSLSVPYFLLDLSCVCRVVSLTIAPTRFIDDPEYL
jgi:hypothetical protein